MRYVSSTEGLVKQEVSYHGGHPYYVCTKCHGTGDYNHFNPDPKDYRKCTACEGIGKLWIRGEKALHRASKAKPEVKLTWWHRREYRVCKDCMGTGSYSESYEDFLLCEKCSGTGKTGLEKLTKWNVFNNWLLLFVVMVIISFSYYTLSTGGYPKL